MCRAGLRKLASRSIQMAGESEKGRRQAGSKEKAEKQKADWSYII
jgi:hypothetical protein